MADTMHVQLDRPVRFAGDILAAGSKLNLPLSQATAMIHAKQAHEISAEEFNTAEAPADGAEASAEGANHDAS